MILGLFSIFDLKSRAFTAPFAAPNRAVAERVFFDAQQDNDTLYGQHPEDFELVEVGAFNVATGEITPITSGHVVPLVTAR